MEIILKQDHIWELSEVKPGGTKIFVWKFSVTDSTLAKNLFPLLSEEEKKQASVYKQERTRLHYLIGHGALRRILSRIFSCSPDHLRFSKEEHGKPFLLSPDVPPGSTRPSTVYFNLSHSGDYVALALSLCTPVGIDIQDYRTHIFMDSLVSRFFHPQEAQVFLTLSEAQKPEFLFSRWALREAFLKGLGTGLSLSPASFLIEADPQDGKRYSVRADQKESQKDFSFWQLCLLPAPEHYAFAIAYLNSSYIAGSCPDHTTSRENK